MGKQELQNEKLKKLERNILRAGRMSDKQLEEIIAAPHLFSSIQVKINSGEFESELRSVSPFQLKHSKTNWKHWSFSFGFCALLIIGIAGLVMNKRNNSKDISSNRQKTDRSLQPSGITKESKQSTEIARIPAEENNEAPTAILKDKNLSKSAIQTTVNYEKLQRNKPERASYVKRQLSQENPADEKFYPITSAQDLEEARQDGQVVRVELSRNSLLSLGVNIPAENTREKIKTDLLIGSDGVTRAIRVVK